MLNFEIMQKHEGLRLLGSADDFRRFHGILHDVNERSPVVFDKEGVFIALAYDVRKASEGQRLIRKATKHDPYSGPTLGVDISWPTILVQCRMLRVSVGFIDSSKLHQAFAYAFEGLVDEGLQEDFAVDYQRIQERYLALQPEHPWLEEKCSSRIEHWARWTASERQRGLIALLESLDPMFPFDYEMRMKRGDAGLMSPEEWDATDVD